MNRIKELEAMLAMKDESIAQLSEFLNTQSEKLATLEAKLDEGKVPELEEEISQLKQLIEGKQESLTELGEFLTAMTAKNADYEQKIQKMETELEQQKAEWTKEKEALTLLDPSAADPD